jgi:hypothetical protein
MVLLKLFQELREEDVKENDGGDEIKYVTFAIL